MAQSGNPYSCQTAMAKRKMASCTEDLEAARVSSFALVEKGVIASNVTGAALVAAILQAEKDCKAYVYRETAGGYDGGTTVKSRAGGRKKEKTTGRTHTATLVDFEYVGNEEHWQSVEANQLNYDLFMFTETRAWPVQNADLNIEVKGAIADDTDVNIEGEVIVTWNRISKPVSMLCDVKALEEKPFLPFVSLTNEGASAATLSGETVTIAGSATMDVIATFTGATTYMLKEGTQALPTGLTFTAAGHLTGTAPATPGVTTHVLRAENACGLAGEITVTIEIV